MQVFLRRSHDGRRGHGPPAYSGFQHDHGAGRSPDHHGTAGPGPDDVLVHGGAGDHHAPAAPLAPLIVLDPGHSGTSLTTIDPATQVRDEEYRNTPETQNMFEVAMLLQAKLEAAGYRVLVTKQAWDDTVCKRDRVNFANQNGAALGVSIHTSGHTFGHYGQIYVQRMDSYREDIHGEKVYFALPEVAALSAQYGDIFLEERRKIEGSSVVITVNSGWGARGLAPGNLPIVQLFAEVPWLLMEAGVPQDESDKDRLRSEPVQQHREVRPHRGRG